MEYLTSIINNLKKHVEVDSVFLTGSQGSEHKPYSDIDLVIILNTNTHNIKSLYTWIDNKFADIFFFDHADLERIGEAKVLPGNNMDSVFVTWLQKSAIQFDKSGKLTALKERAEQISHNISIPDSEKKLFSEKINYNFVANTRYFESKDTVYHEALEVRLLYSVSEVFTGYFEFRNITWRGEKNALKYLRENDSDFYNAFKAYTKATSLEARFDTYSRLVKLVFPSGYSFWSKGEVIPQQKDREKSDQSRELVEYWKQLIRA